MQDNLINQNAQPYTYVQNQPYAPQPQPYAQPVPQQNYNVPYAAQPGLQPYAVQTPQQYVVQPGIQVTADFKRKLCCPNVFSWVVFVISLLYVIQLFTFSGYINLPAVIYSIIHLIIAIFVSLSVEKRNANMYNCALISYIIFFSLFVIFYIIILLNSEYFYFSDIIIIATKIALLIVLPCYKKEFNTVQMPANQEPITPSVL